MSIFASRGTVSSFLRQHPKFTFDVEEFLLAFAARGDIEAKYQSFKVRNFLNRDRWPAKAEIVEWLSGPQRNLFPFYSKYPADLDLTTAPLIGKSEARSNIGDLRPLALKPHEVWTRKTTGSSGPPMEILYSKNFHFDMLYLSPRRILTRAGLMDVSKALNILSLSEHRDHPSVITIDPSHTGLVTFHSIVDTTDEGTFHEVFDIMRELDSVCLSSKPSVLENLLALAAGQDSLPKLHSIISGGSFLSDGLRRQLADRFKCPVVNAYGMTEVGIIASECVRGGMHLDKSSFYVEVVSDAGACAPDGIVGELVVSRVDNDAMPFVRYRTGDTGALSTKSCSCGVPGPTITNFTGRKIVCIKFPSGRYFSPTYFNGLMQQFPEISEYQLTQRALDHVQIAVETKRLDTGWLELRCAIEKYCRSVFPPEMQVEISCAQFKRDSKFQRFRSCL